MSELGILFTHAAELILGILEGKLLGTKVMAADIDELLCVGDTGLSSAVFVLKLLQFIGLSRSFVGLSFVRVLKVANFPVHFSALDFDSFDFSFKVSFVCTLVGTCVSFGHCIFSQPASLKVLLI